MLTPNKLKTIILKQVIVLSNLRNKVVSIYLVGWAGRDFLHLDFDQAVTSIEGANGVGKTSKMYASIICRIPFKEYLDFSNVGAEKSNNKKTGLYGRLGPGPVAYTLLECLVHEPRSRKAKKVWVGVKIEKRTFPDYELYPFILTGEWDAGRLYNLFFQKNEHRTVMLGSTIGGSHAELSRAVMKAGGSFSSYSKTEYARKLYEYQINPLKLSNSKEKNLFSSLINLSLRGGLSSTVLSQLKLYILSSDDSSKLWVKRAQEKTKTSRSTIANIKTYMSNLEFIEYLYSQSTQLLCLLVRELRQQYEHSVNEIKAIRLNSNQALLEKIQLRSDKNLADKEVKQLLNEIKDVKNELLAIEEDKSLARSAWECKESLLDKKRCLEKNNRKEAEEVSKYQDISVKINVIQSSYDKKSNLVNNIIEEILDKEEAFTKEQSRATRYSHAFKCINDLLPELQSRQLTQAKTTSDLASSLELSKTNLEKEVNSKLLEISDLNSRVKLAKWTGEKYTVALDSLNDILAKDSGLKDEVLQGQHLQAEQAYEISEKVLLHTSKMKLLRQNLTLYTRQVEDCSYQLRNFEKLNDLIRGYSELGSIDSLKKWNDVFQELSQRKSNNESLIFENNRQIAIETKEISKKKIYKDSIEAKVREWLKFNSIKDNLSNDYGVKLFNREDYRAEFSRVNKDIIRVENNIVKIKDDLSNLKIQLDQLINSHHHQTPDEVKIIAEAIGGTCLSEYFSECSLEQAAYYEGRLGPLINAICVENIQKSAEDIIEQFAPEQRPKDLYLVDVSKVDELRTNKAASDLAVVVHQIEYTRITKLPDVPLLGELAKENLIESTSEKIEILRERKNNLISEQNRLYKALELFEKLSAYTKCFDWDDPKDFLEDVNKTIDALSESLKAINIQQTKMREETARLIKLLSQMSSLKDCSYLLDESMVKLTSELAVAKEQFQEGKEADSRLLEINSAIEVLKVNQHHLKTPPIEDIEKEQERLLRYRDQFEQLMALNLRLDELIRVAPDLVFKESFDRMQKEDLSDLLGELNKQKHRLQSELVKDSVKLDEFRKKSADFSGNIKYFERVREEYQNEIDKLLNILSSNRFSGEKVEYDKILDSHQDKSDELENLNKLHLQVSGEFSVLCEKYKISCEKSKSIRNEFKRAFKSHRDFVRKLNSENDRLKNDYDFYDSIMDASVKIDNQDKYEPQRANIISALYERTRLKTEIESVKKLNRIVEEAKNGVYQCHNVELLIQEAMDVYIQTNDVFVNIMPKDIRFDSSISNGIYRLKQTIDGLVKSLEKTESDLTENISNFKGAIVSKINSEKRNIKKLNDHLKNVSFGNISGIRIAVSDNHQKFDILDKLLDKDTLFANDKDINEASKELYFKEFGKQLGGDDLFDYRSYLEVKVEVKRLDRTKWELGTPDTLSTGESLGVGYGLLHVILRSWERQSETLLGKNSNFIRFMPMDEISRLDDKAIKTLVKFCKDYEIQLFIASPVQNKHYGLCYRFLRLDKGLHMEKIYGSENTLASVGFQNFDTDDNNDEDKMDTNQNLEKDIFSGLTRNSSANSFVIKKTRGEGENLHGQL